MSKWGLIAALFLVIATLNILNILETKEAANLIIVGPGQYPQCQLTVTLSVLEELGDTGMWDWMAQCIVDAETYR